MTNKYMQTSTEQLIQSYYQAFNQQDMTSFLNLLSDDVVHDINQGQREQGKGAFSAFMSRMNQHYQEQIVDIVVCCDSTGTRAAAEFMVQGKYLSTDAGLPEANGQIYLLPAGAFFSIDTQQNKITRVSNYYNLPDWIKQVSA